MTSSRCGAKANDLPAFMVFSNKTLIDLANRNPTCEDELYEVYGFGQAKVEGLGAEVLKCLQT
jgi:ATP-dependent DNA helicase RecQ